MSQVNSRMSYEQIRSLSYDKLQKLLLERFPGKAVRGLKNRTEELKLLSIEDLMITTEYTRRNLSFGRDGEELVTYEDAAKVLYLPELLRRLSEVIEIGPLERK